MKIPIKQYQELLADYLKPQWPRVILLSLLLLGGIGAQTFNPQMMRYFIDAAVTGSPLGKLVIAAFIFMGVAILHQIFAVSARYVSEKVGWIRYLREFMAFFGFKIIACASVFFANFA